MHNPSDENTPVSSDASYRAMKWVAIIMGVIMVGGFIFLFAMLAKQASAPKKKACEPSTIVIGQNSDIMKQAEKDDIITFWLREEGSLVIRRYSMCDGSILSDVRIAGGKPAAPQGGVPQPMPGRMP